MRLADVTERMRPYRPYGAAEQLLYFKGDEGLLAGPAGTGKSRSILEKIHACAEKYPGMRALILRKTRASLTDSGLVTFEDKVLPTGHPALEGAQRAQRHSYRYPNGSEIVVGGLDKPSKVMSTEFDLIYIQEAIEVTENDWESVTTRLRNGVMPYQQLLADTNPDKPTHWLLQRCQRGQTRMFESRHEDNPVYWDRVRGEWTDAGKKYIARLDALTGVRLHRLRYGKWVAAEGLVHEDFDSAVHVIDRFDVPHAWRRLWVIDFGYTNPFVWQEWRIDPDGRMFRVREIYHTRRLVEDHAKRILELTEGEPRPEAIVCDHDAEDRATLERHLGMKTSAAHKSVSDGLQAVASRLRDAGDGRARMYFLRDSLDERDPDLVEKKLPTCTEEEFDGYVWDTRGGQRKGEQPVKENDHGMDAMRYGVAAEDLVAPTYVHAASGAAMPSLPSFNPEPTRDEFDPFSSPF